MKPPTNAFISPVNGSIATIPPFTFGYCFKTHLSFIFYEDNISQAMFILNDSFFDRDHFKELKLNLPEIFLFSKGF